MLRANGKILKYQIAAITKNHRIENWILNDFHLECTLFYIRKPTKWKHRNEQNNKQESIKNWGNKKIVNTFVFY
jgi:hypothetical protein